MKENDIALEMRCRVADSRFGRRNDGTWPVCVSNVEITSLLDEIERLRALTNDAPVGRLVEALDRFDAHRLAIANRRPSAKRDELLSELETIRNSMCRSALTSTEKEG